MLEYEKICINHCLVQIYCNFFANPIQSRRPDEFPQTHPSLECAQATEIAGALWSEPTHGPSCSEGVNRVLAILSGSQAMLIALHKNERTTPAVLAEIATNYETASLLAQRFWIT